MSQVRTISNSISSEFMKRSTTNRTDMIAFWKPYESYGCFSQLYSEKDGHFTFKQSSIPDSLFYNLEQALLHLDHQMDLSLIEGIQFDCLQRFIVMGKILLFNKIKVRRLRNIADPSLINNFELYGIRNVDFNIWSQINLIWTTIGNYLKFQNPALRSVLHSSNGKFLANANPYDKTFGIGISTANSSIHYPNKWKDSSKMKKGNEPTNKLGESLMTVRAML